MHVSWTPQTIPWTSQWGRNAVPTHGQNTYESGPSIDGNLSQPWNWTWRVWYWIHKLKRCLPNLKRFIAVEKNADCVTQLRSNLQNSFPHLDKVIHQESFHEWKGPDCQVDVILMFHIFYYFEREDRLKLMEKFQSWLKPETGVMVVLHFSDEVEKVLSNFNF